MFGFWPLEIWYGKPIRVQESILKNLPHVLENICCFVFFTNFSREIDLKNGSFQGSSSFFIQQKIIPTPPGTGFPPKR